MLIAKKVVINGEVIIRYKLKNKKEWQNTSCHSLAIPDNKKYIKTINNNISYKSEQI